MELKNSHFYQGCGDFQLIALIDENPDSRVSFQARLGVLGYFSVGFGSPEEALNSESEGRNFDCIVFVLKNEGSAFLQFKRELENLGASLLFVTLQESLSVLAGLGEFAIAPMNFDAVPLNCSDRELAWRLHFLLRRGAGNTAKERGFCMAGYRFDKKNKKSWLKGEEVRLKPLEFELAFELFRNINFTLSRDWLYSTVWEGLNKLPNSRRLDACVSSVRKKLKICPANGFILRAVYGRGYRLCSVPEK
ncbi:DNA-binding response OmpR family regulator [Variovorax boronicumulans]|uniref:response regulator transcription factor n=1 Tax=Variovorax boronicumulans TaxID=436515 RepID=UPI00278A8D9E|nr:winged helix-turn-helix domain-containing protein [Variovorax boronicumulans]MDQ0017841.1 DNA-binding response OmpR family regulator [Variovorax boronicumulans]